jgi:hypothetical protein
VENPHIESVETKCKLQLIIVQKYEEKLEKLVIEKEKMREKCGIVGNKELI